MAEPRRRSGQVTSSPQRADARVWEYETATQGDPSSQAARQLLHELRVHQVELEAQNEELRRAQAALEASQARYFDLYDLAPIGYLTLSEPGLILEANFTAANLLGLARSALIKQPFTRFIVPEDQDHYYRYRRRLFQAGVTQVCEVRLLKAASDPFWARLQATIARHDDSSEVVSRVVVSDVNERKRAEEALRASETRHRIMFEKSHDALMTLAPPAWRYTSVNAASITMFGARDETDFLSRAPRHYSPERQPDGCASAEKLAAMIAMAMRDGTHSFEWTHRRLSGEDFPATVVLTRMDIDNQTLLQATVHDETEKRAFEATVAQADRLASMGMLAAGVAHEINNPLAYVLLNVEGLAQDLPKVARAVERCTAVLRDQVGDAAFAQIVGNGAELLRPAALENAVHRAQEALDGAQRIRSISRGLGAFSRVESVEQSAVQLAHAIEHAATMAHNEIKYRARLVKDLGVVPPVWASEGKLSQVFLNLLINAAHAIDEGDRANNTIGVRTWAEGRYVFGEVTDSGQGILAADLERIFEPFYTTKKMGVGSGLGLAICKNIITGFGGEIRVESQPGAGSRFVVRLPAHREAPEDRRAETASETLPQPPVRGRILVVDDEDAIRRVMVRVLGPAHEIVTAASGQEARAILEQDRAFDVILCDLMMPLMSGMDLHQWLATYDPALAQQVVFISGGAFTPRAIEYLASVRNLLLEKPFDMASVTRVVSERMVAAGSRK